tara:strand:- start:411 stop:1217 length:807 start_codon:yes stop_codon:yes gene_type:complete
MKLSHNKKRNTAFIYEMLIKELSKASMHNIIDKKKQILSIIKESFSKEKLMRRELEIYKSFEDVEKLEKNIVEKVIIESKKQFMNLDRKKIFDEQTRTISKINKVLDGDAWSTFIPEFRKVATINQILNQNLSPKNQVLLEKKFVEGMQPDLDNKKPFPNINNLAVKTFVEKFNDEYSASLTENQKTLLNKYISSYEDRGIGLKTYLYEEIDRIKEQLSLSLEDQDTKTAKKIKKIVERMNNYNQRKVDKSFIAEIMRAQLLAEEINK